LLGGDARGREGTTHAHLQELPEDWSQDRSGDGFGHLGIDLAPSGRAAAGPWQPVDLDRPEGLSALIAQARAIADRAGGAGGASVHNDLAWLLGDDPARAAGLRVLGFRNGDAAGYAAFLVRPRPLKFQLGEVTLAQHRLRYHTLSGEPLLVGLDEPARYAAMESFLDAARAMLGPGDALALEGVPVGGALDRLVATAPPASFAVTRLGAPFEHQLIDMPADWPAYEAQLGTRSRKSLRYSRKKLAEHVGGQLEARCFQTPAELDRFLADSVAVSRKTYQWNLLGLGLRDREALEARLRFAAAHGWLRCYILYCGDQPTAFMLGLLHGDTYYYLDVGYDPDWAKWSVGSVLQVEVMQDLFALPTPPKRFDFSTGYGAHKARFGNVSRREANWLLLPAGWRSAALLGGYRATERVGAGLSQVLARYDLKARLKKLVRGRAVARAEPEVPS
jgi:CelD/BcsL family acetyltransferase involved in cellulose biosynthesis